MQFNFKNFKYSIFLSLLLITLYYFFLYSNTWNIFIGNSQIVFSDLKQNIHWLKCNYEDFKVYEDNSCNLVKTNYGPSLFLIPFNESLEIFYVKFFPYIIYLIFIVVSILVNNPKNLIQSFILFIFIFNPAVFLLLERMNFDVYIFLLLVFIIYNRFYILNWITVIFLGLTKIYPFIFGISIFIENLNRSKKNLIYIFIFISFSALIFVILNLNEYLYILTSKGGKAGLHLLFSIKSISKILKYTLDINYIISLPIILGFTFSINCFATFKETSASSNANLMVLKPSSTCFSLRDEAFLREEKTSSNLFVKFSNIFITHSSNRTSGRTLAD